MATGAPVNFFDNGKLPRTACAICGKPGVIVHSTRGKQSVGYCGRIHQSMARYAKRYTGARSELYSTPVDLGKRGQI